MRCCGLVCRKLAEAFAAAILAEELLLHASGFSSFTVTAVESLDRVPLPSKFVGENGPELRVWAPPKE